MSDETTTPELDDSMTVKYGLGWRNTKTGEIDNISENNDPASGHPVFACEIPPVIAYEIGWALSMYGKTLHEYVTEGPDDDTRESAAQKRDIALSLAASFRDAGIRGVKIETGEELGAYDTSEDFETEEGDANGGEA